MTLRSSDLQSDSDLDSIRNSCDVLFAINVSQRHKSRVPSRNNSLYAVSHQYLLVTWQQQDTPILDDWLFTNNDPK